MSKEELTIVDLKSRFLRNAKYGKSYKDVDFSDLKSKTLYDIVVNDEKNEIIFICVTGEIYKMFHFQDCCETVEIEDICGDIGDLIGSEILSAECVTSDYEDDEISEHVEREDSQTWTFYKLDTILGGVTIRWYGTSNGYYSEGVDFVQVMLEEEDKE